MIRKIIHIDMDAFYASVEQRDNPSLQGKPVVVGSNQSRGVISAASYEARKFGIYSAMPSVTAARRCPHLEFVYPDFKKYMAVSEQIQSIFFEYTDHVEPLSLDEAFLDVTIAKRGKPSATLIANEIRQRIFEETGLRASAGISYCKFLAKIASDVNKPNGYFVITPTDAPEFLKKLEIKKFYGIGKKTAEHLGKQGIHFGKDLLAFSQQDLIRQFGKSGSYYYDMVRGIDNRPVLANRTRKSIGAEHTFSKDYRQLDILSEQLILICDELWQRINRTTFLGRTITLKLKFEDFSQITRSQTRISHFQNKEEIIRDALLLLQKEAPFEKKIRLIGISTSNFTHENIEAVQLVINF
ncbi:MAG: DNA polymerase IV [Mangrovibacterium sp.]